LVREREIGGRRADEAQLNDRVRDRCDQNRSTEDRAEEA
jgi:hypothetical protein